MRKCFAIFLLQKVNYLVMKKFICCVLIFIGIVVFALNLPKSNDYDYLRIHIRANSNSSIDQNVKYKVKDAVVDYLTPKMCNVKTKQQAIDLVEKEKNNLSLIGKNLLLQNGLNYSVNIKISNEYFPARTYVNTTLESGYYDAVIVELGEAVGDNWWCVMYPPLCFVDENQTDNKIKFASRLKNWFNNLFK